MRVCACVCVCVCPVLQVNSLPTERVCVCVYTYKCMYYTCMYNTIKNCGAGGDFWERLRAEGEEGVKGRDGWVASLMQ